MARPKPGQRKIAQPNLNLTGVIGFTEADLDANRDGYMTKEQRARMSRARRRWRNMSILGLTFGLIPSVFVTPALLEGGFVYGIQAGTVVYGVIWILPTIFLWYTVRQWQQLNADLWKGAVFPAVGRTRPGYIRFSHPRIYYRATIDEVQFDIWRDLYTVLQAASLKNREIIIYYTPHSRTILSAEWVSNAAE